MNPHRDLDTVGLTRREMLLQSALSLSALCCDPSKPKDGIAPAKPNIIVFLADSWRNDHVGCNGYPVNVTPEIDRFAESSHIFRRCYSTATWTKPSVASIFTGVYPTVHQAAHAGGWSLSNENAQVQLLRPCFQTIAETLKRAGYQTAWFLGNPMIQEKFGFARGFDTYELILKPDPLPHIKRAAEWLYKEAREPFFLMIHFIDPHFPFIPKDKFMRQVANQTVFEYLNTIPGADGELLRTYYANNGNVVNLPNYGGTYFKNMSPAGVRALETMYDAEIAGVDQQFGRLRRLLEHLGLFDRSVIAVTSDHGEAFGEHGLFYHQQAPYEHQLRVPLILRLPGQDRGQQVDTPVSLLDLYPTLLAQAGETPPPYIQGHNLFDAQGKLPAGARTPVFIDRDRFHPNKWDCAVVSGNLKVLNLAREEGIHVFDLEEDPGETRDLMKTSRGQDQDVQEAIEGLLDHHADCLALANAFGPPEWYRPDQQDTAAMEALGYL